MIFFNIFLDFDCSGQYIFDNLYNTMLRDDFKIIEK